MLSLDFVAVVLCKPNCSGKFGRCVFDKFGISLFEGAKLCSLPYLPLCVLLQDVGLRAMANRVPETDLDAFHTAAAAQILTGQSHEAASLREAGIMLIDTPPDLLTERLINEYLSIKAQNLM